MYYLLDKNKNPFPVTIQEMGTKFEESFKERIVKKTFLDKYKVEISTVFLGIDHGHLLGLTPVLFETMVFWTRDQPLHHWQDRYCTWKSAYYGHNHAVRLVIENIRNQLKENPNKKFIASKHWNETKGIMTPEEFKNKHSKEIYLGDGLYASFDGYHINLRAPRELGDHHVSLEPEVYESLIEYRNKIYEDFKLVRK